MAGMGRILGPGSDVFIASVLSVLLFRAMEIWDRECGPFRPDFAVFAVLGHIGNTISACGKAPSQ